MPIYTFGWVEVSRLEDSELDEDYAWSGLVDLSTYVDSVDEVAEILFGYSKRLIRQEHQIEAIAKDRGLPKNPSDHLKNDINQYEDYFGLTFIYFNEFKEIDWNQYQLGEADSDWIRLINLLKKLLEEKRFQAHKIRIVVWFNW